MGYLVAPSPHDYQRPRVSHFTSAAKKLQPPLLSVKMPRKFDIFIELAKIQWEAGVTLGGRWNMGWYGVFSSSLSL